MIETILVGRFMLTHITRTCTHTHTYIHASNNNTNTNTHTHIHTHMHTHANTHPHTYTYTRNTQNQAQIVRLVKQSEGVTTLAVGDGANDEQMIRESDVGVGIHGVEGTAAVRASDYAISQVCVCVCVCVCVRLSVCEVM